jgi:transcriptional regulator
MYNPPHFEETRPEELERIITEYPLGTLVYSGPNGLDAAHLPFIYKAEQGAEGKLIAHVARKNLIWQQVPNGTEVLTIFHGSNSYISPNWYPSKQETHRHVPTWNYQVVHIHGRIRFIDDAKFLHSVVARLTQVHETRAAEPKPWRMSDGDKDYIEQQIASIVGLEVDITRIVGKSKLSQNRESRDKEGAIAALRRKGENATADAMERVSQTNG